MLVAGRPRGLAAAPGMCFVLRLLDASAAKVAWKSRAPVTDYDGLRREVAAIFADAVVEVLGLVAKLQQTSAPPSRLCTSASLPAHRGGCIASGAIRKLAPRDAAESNAAFNKGPSA